MNKRGSTAEVKEHYKMYKSGSKWVFAGILTLGVGLTFTVTAPAQAASADTAAPATTTAVKDATTKTATTTPATTTDPDTATETDQTTATEQPAKTVATPTTDTKTATDDDATKVSTPATTTDTTKDTTVAATTTTQPAATTDKATTNDTTYDANTTTKAADDQTTVKNVDTDPTPTTTTTAPANQDTLTKGNVQGLWDEGYQGQGMVVAVIDSGVEPHADLRLSDPSTAAISKDDAEAAIAKLGYGTYVNSKIPFAYDYVNNDSVNTGTTASGSTHGEHVAGIIAANGTTADGDTQDPIDYDGDGTVDSTMYVKGVAPEAQILAMQVIDEFPDENSNDISRAIRDAVDLGANVIQMSLGIGVAEQDLTDEEQAAVKYATDHGVFVSISASNNGNAASIVGGPDQGGIGVAYDSKNSSTIADPAAAASAMTVAAETSDLGENSQMASFSSWGPLVDYTLKPDISAPGSNVISTAIDPSNDSQTYASLSGTSMAGPYDAGAALIVMQKLQATRPDLQGADLVAAVKLALMNAADPMADIQYADTYISPRRQGAGQIDVSKAGDLTVSAKSADENGGTGSVSLHTIGDTTTFTVTVTNYGDSDQTYQVETNGGPLTEVIDATNNNTVHDVSLAGATLTADQPTFTLAAGTSRQVTFTLKLDDTVQADQLVEGFLTFKAADDSQTISMPYLGYYGDLTDEPVIDAATNTGDAVFDGGYLVDEDANILGVSDPSSLHHLVNAGTGTTWENVAVKVENGKVSFSPNGDDVSDTVYPYVFSKQSLEGVEVQILDAKGNVVRVLDKENNLNKSYYQDGSSYNNDLGLSIDMRLNTSALTWDGTVYDQATGKMVTAPDGNYTYRLVSTQYNDGSDSVQDYDLPVSVDTTKPTVTGLSYQDGTVTAAYADTGVGFTQYSNAVLTIGDRTYGVPLTSDAASGTLKYTLTAAQQDALKASDGVLTLTVTDVAGNSTAASVQAVAGTNTAKADAAVTAPQFSWLISPGDHNMVRPGDGMGQIVADGTIDVQGIVPAGEAYRVVATDAITGQTYTGDVDQATGLVTFHNVTVTGDGYGYVYLIAQASLETNFGDYLQTQPQTNSNDALLIFYQAGFTYTPDAAQSTVLKPFVSNDEALASESAAPAHQLSGRAFSDITTHAEPTTGLSFDKFNDNTFTLVGADQVKDVYDAQTGLLTITGHLDDPADKVMTVTSASEPTKQVTVQSDGSFSFTVPFKASQQQAVGYRILTKGEDGHYSTQYGELQIYLDTVFPTLSMPQADSLKVGADGTYEITTTAATFNVAGLVDDNVNGYRLYANGDNVVHQKNLAGFNNHVDPESLYSNPYGPADFNETYTLAMGDNYFTITAVDMAGNTVSKVFHVVREAEPVTDPDSGETGTEPKAGSDDTDSTTGTTGTGTQAESGLAGETGSSATGAAGATKAATGEQTDPTAPKLELTRQAADQNDDPAPTPLATSGSTKSAVKPATAGATPSAKTSDTTAQPAATAAALPQTGEQASPLAALGLWVLGLLGLAHFGRRKRTN
ncbi:S8 family serine peptidase [Lactiplantibacillus plajomi]|uniref:S8 family serine peptidase n=1 Tax=Lactiplantibacillus plajomi TaxID=1457217 RepID=A0ABV6K190_9LACO|nr:S8 family serine peptidase [Lactiplantibacillus plajomi]